MLQNSLFQICKTRRNTNFYLNKSNDNFNKIVQINAMNTISENI